MSFIKPISAYTQKAHKKRQREANGPSGAYFVYVVYSPGADGCKVGRTNNLRRRMTSYSGRLGHHVKYLGYAECVDEQASNSIEASLIEAMAEKFPKENKEWFLASEEAAAACFLEVARSSRASIVSVNGFGNDKREGRSEHFKEMMSLKVLVIPSRN